MVKRVLSILFLFCLLCLTGCDDASVSDASLDALFQDYQKETDIDTIIYQNTKNGNYFSYTIQQTGSKVSFQRQIENHDFVTESVICHLPFTGYYWCENSDGSQYMYIFMKGNITGELRVVDKEEFDILKKQIEKMF